MFEQDGVPGVDGAVVSGGPVTEARMRSRFGPPFTVVAAARMRLLPAFRFTVTFTSAHVAHAPVPGKFTVVPLTDSGRFAVVPLAYRNVSVAEPALAALIAHST